MHKGKTARMKKAIMDGVHKALVSAFKIPKTDRNILLNEYARQHFSGRTKDFTIIEITAFSGRSKPVKKQLYNEIVKNLCNDAGLRPEDIFIIIYDVEMENWGIRGGKMASEIDIGFKIDV